MVQPGANLTARPGASRRGAWVECIVRKSKRRENHGERDRSVKSGVHLISAKISIMPAKPGGPVRRPFGRYIGRHSVWELHLHELGKQYDFKTRRPFVGDVRRIFAQEFHVNSEELCDFYTATNGLSAEWFVIFPILDSTDITHTWNDLRRVNSLTSSPYLAADPSLFNRFFVFSDIGATQCATIDRQDGTIWFEQDGEMHQTSLDLKGFVERCLLEVKEL